MPLLPPEPPRLPPRSAEASKRDFGRVLVIGGSAGMAGAPALSAMAALRSGAGLVELAVPEPSWNSRCPSLWWGSRPGSIRA